MNRKKFRFKLHFIIWTSILLVLVVVYVFIWILVIDWYTDSQINQLKKELEETTMLITNYSNSINECTDYIDNLSSIYKNDLKVIVIIDNDIIDYSNQTTLIYDINLKDIEKIKNKNYYILFFDDVSYCFCKTNITDNQSDIYIMNSCAKSQIHSNFDLVDENLKYLMIISYFISLIISYVCSIYISRPISSVVKDSMMIGQNGYYYCPKKSRIEEIDNIQESLSKLENRLNETEKFSKEFLSAISHELKSPLTIIKSYTEMLKDFVLNYEEKALDNINIINEQIVIMTDYINDINLISKVQSNYYDDKKIIDLGSVLLNVCDDFSVEVNNRNIEFNLNIGNNLECNANLLCIRYCFTNYISNAIKFANKKIDINLYRNYAKIIFEVINDGPKIDENDIKNIWNHFYKNESSNGSGIGLAFVKIICDHCGYIYSVHSDDNITKFVIEIEE